MQSQKETTNTPIPNTALESEWLSFEQMISPSNMADPSRPEKDSEFLVSGLVAYPGMKTVLPHTEVGLPAEKGKY